MPRDIISTQWNKTHVNLFHSKNEFEKTYTVFFQTKKEKQMLLRKLT